MNTAVPEQQSAENKTRKSPSIRISNEKHDLKDEQFCNDVYVDEGRLLVGRIFESTLVLIYQYGLLPPLYFLVEDARSTENLQ